MCDTQKSNYVQYCMAKYSIPFTKTGFLQFQKEYEDLQQKRPQYVKELSIARDMGDRSENAAYKDARRRLSSTDSRLRFLKRIIEHAKVIEPTQTEYVEIGSKVTVLKDNQEITFHIVGEHEADLNQKRLSYKSPVGKMLLHKKSGDTVQVQLPAGSFEYHIVKISLT